MDYVLDWKLIHRNEDDMHRLFSNSVFRQPSSRVFFEEWGINLFAKCDRVRRPLNSLSLVTL